MHTHVCVCAEALGHEQLRQGTTDVVPNGSYAKRNYALAFVHHTRTGVPRQALDRHQLVAPSYRAEQSEMVRGNTELKALTRSCVHCSPPKGVRERAVYLCDGAQCAFDLGEQFTSYG